MANPKSSIGCWTCRLRHKKCDGRHPICCSCQSLDISCYYGHDKPDWMDNGKRQHAMAQQVKAELKRSANRRRGRRLIRSIAQGIGDGEHEILSGLDHDRPSSILLPPPVDSGPSNLTTSSETSENSSRANPATQDHLYTSIFPNIDTSLSDDWRNASNAPINNILQATSGVGDGQDVQLSFPLFQNELQLSVVMTYLDCVFPVLFPFYKPTILEGGRNWLLVILMKNKGLCHTVISLTSYFFSIVPVMPGATHHLCTSKIWEELEKQTDLAIKMVQHDLQEVNRRGVNSDLHGSAYLMESIVQLLGFEVIFTHTENWQIHLDAAIVLFKQIFQYYGTTELPTDISSILAQMGHKAFVTTPSNLTLWNADQAAFRFFSTVLLVHDIISSTSLEHAPRLRDYHKHLLTNDLKPDQEAPLQLEGFIGCQNWAMLLIGEVATLNAWKKDMKKSSTLSMAQLVQRADVIDQTLQEGLARLDGPDSRQRPSSKPSAIDILAQYKLYNHEPKTPDGCMSLTRIWAYAAQTYLLVVVSGWQPANPDIRNSVARTIELLTELDSPGWLRTLAWPLCVTGCLAEEGQEATIREIVGSMGALQMFGTMREAQSIMENTWQRRAQINADSWDLAACLRCLGRRVLLV